MFLIKMFEIIYVVNMKLNCCCCSFLFRISKNLFPNIKYYVEYSVSSVISIQKKIFFFICWNRDFYHLFCVTFPLSRHLDTKPQTNKKKHSNVRVVWRTNNRVGDFTIIMLCEKNSHYILEIKLFLFLIEYEVKCLSFMA